MTEFEKGLVRDYKSIMAHIERTVSSVHGILTKANIDERGKLETQLVNRGLSHSMGAEALENYHYYRNSPSDRPLYCPDLKEDEDCPACGATVERGVCRAINSGPEPRPLVEIILVHRATGKPVTFE